MLNQDIIEARKTWIKALRSGEFKQGHAALFTNDEGTMVGPSLSKEETNFCCIGVQAFLLGHPNFYLSVRIACGYGHSTQSILVKMNDIERVSFEAIADYIESWPNELMD